MGKKPFECKFVTLGQSLGAVRVVRCRQRLLVGPCEVCS